jgi:ribosomal protein S18 acetylase RimI-like enzyme
MQIRPFAMADQEAVIALWRDAGLVRPWNDPYKDIQRKMAEQPELFLVGALEDQVIASAMVGYEGHRGWIYYMAVSPALQGKALGAQIIRAAEDLLLARGCPKVCLMVRTTNTAVIEFYRKQGYEFDAVVAMAKRLIHDNPQDNPHDEPVSPA